MNEKQIDVLAVLDTACKLHKEGAYADAWEVDLERIYEVRAAVAELILAARAASNAIGLRLGPEMLREAGEALDAALARVRSS